MQRKTPGECGGDECRGGGVAELHVDQQVEQHGGDGADRGVDEVDLELRLFGPSTGGHQCGDRHRIERFVQCDGQESADAGHCDGRVVLSCGRDGCRQGDSIDERVDCQADKDSGPTESMSGGVVVGVAVVMVVVA